MTYSGNKLAAGYDETVTQTFASPTGTTFTLDHPVASQSNIMLVINNVVQEPTVAYTASGLTLTVSEALIVTDDMWCVFNGLAVQTSRPPDGSVSTESLGAGAVTNSKIATAAIDNTKLASTVITGQSNTTISAIDKILLSDTDDSGNLKEDTVQGILDLVPSGADTSLSNVTAAGADQLCRVWVKFDGTGTPSITDSYNVSSIGDNGVGVYTVNFSNNLDSANYSAVGSTMGVSDRVFVSGDGAHNVAYVVVRCVFYQGNNQDTTSCNVIVIGG